MTLSIGSRIGVYEVIAKLGQGGMGEVYRARDTRLDREVAIKVLPPSVAGDADRILRFEREARTLAALNHPHIAQIHGTEDSGGTRALVMELVEGEDLAQRLSRGPIPLDESLAIAEQIADALQAAHAAGIVHRDLKPANVKLRPDGTIKVLDFGLAKAGGAARSGGGDVLDSPTFTSPVATMQGVILGTAAYMSPEQARGKPVDSRADVWAFGCVLYEMLTGRRAFQGEDVTETLAAVVTQHADLTGVPASCRRLIGACLQKDPKKRLRRSATSGTCSMTSDNLPRLSRDRRRAHSPLDWRRWPCSRPSALRHWLSCTSARRRLSTVPFSCRSPCPSPRTWDSSPFLRTGRVCR